MIMIDLPHTDFTFLPDLAMKRLFEYHNGDEHLDFSKMSNEEIDCYIEVWLAHLIPSAVECFYDDAMANDLSRKETILQLYGFVSNKVAVERELIREDFIKPSENYKKPWSWAHKIEDNVNAMIEADIKQRVAEGEA